MVRTKRLPLGGPLGITVPVVTRPTAIGEAEWHRLCRVNDAIVSRVRYDHAKEPATPMQTPQQTLARGSGTCMDYAALFEAAARRVGLEAVSVMSTTLYHAWNRVRLGGRWWEVDVTWNSGGVFAGGAVVPESVRADIDFRRRYLATTRESEERLLAAGLIPQTHAADDVREVDLLRTLEAAAIVREIEDLLGVSSGTRRAVISLPIGENGKRVDRLYEQYRRLEQRYPLANSFSLGERRKTSERRRD